MNWRSLLWDVSNNMIMERENGFTLLEKNAPQTSGFQGLRWWGLT